MTGTEFAKELARREGLSQAKARRVIKSAIAIIRGEVQAEGRFALADLGVFTLRNHKARQVGKIKAPARKAVHFRAAAGFKRAVNLK